MGDGEYAQAQERPGEPNPFAAQRERDWVNSQWFDKIFKANMPLFLPGSAEYALSRSKQEFVRPAKSVAEPYDFLPTGLPEVPSPVFRRQPVREPSFRLEAETEPVWNWNGKYHDIGSRQTVMRVYSTHRDTGEHLLQPAYDFAVAEATGQPVLRHYGLYHATKVHPLDASADVVVEKVLPNAAMEGRVVTPSPPPAFHPPPPAVPVTTFAQEAFTGPVPTVETEYSVQRPELLPAPRDITSLFKRHATDDVSMAFTPLPIRSRAGGPAFSPVQFRPFGGQNYGETQETRTWQGWQPRRPPTDARRLVDGSRHHRRKRRRKPLGGVGHKSIRVKR